MGQEGFFAHRNIQPAWKKLASLFRNPVYAADCYMWIEICSLLPLVTGAKTWLRH